MDSEPGTGIAAGEGGRAVSPVGGNAACARPAPQTGHDQSPGAGLLERDAELSRVRAAVTSPGGVLVVEGEAGIGKSVLLSAGVRLARKAGAMVFTARGGALERGFGYGVARQLFEAPLRAARPTERRRWLAGAAALAGPVLGVEPTGSGAVVDDPAFAAQHGLYWLAANLAAERPTVVAVDDLQWADLASFRWLVYLARRLEGIPLLVLGTWRGGEPEAPGDLLDALGGERIVPAPLSVAATAEMVARGLGRPCDQLTAEACHAGTRGNPLLIAELVSALAADVALPLDPQRVTDLGGVAVARHVRARLAALPVAAREVAAAAAVLDADVTQHQLTAVTGLAPSEVGEACDRLIAGHILTGDRTLEFVHPLVRAAVYDALGPAQRADAHRAAADVLDGDGQADRASAHLLATEPAGDAAVVERLVAAAGRSLVRGAVAEAIVLLRRGLAEPPPAEARYAVLLGLADAELRAGDQAAIGHARGALELAADADEHEAAALLLAKLLTFADRKQEGLTVLEAAAGELRGTAPEHALRLDVEHVSWSLLQPRPLQGIDARAASLAEWVPPASLAAQTLRAELARLGTMGGTLSAGEAAEAALGVLSDGRVVADPSVALAFYWAVGTLEDCERLDECAYWVNRRWELMARIGSRAEPHALAVHRARIARLRGDLAAATDEARFALSEQETRGYGFFVPYAAAQLVTALVEQGELDEADTVLARHRIAGGTNWWFELIPAQVTLALARGDPGRLRAQLAAAPAERTQLPLHMAPCEVAVALATGNRDEALARADAMLAAAERFGAPGLHGMALRLMGLATGGGAGIEHLRAAIEPLEHSPRRLELARALIDLGSALRRSGQRAAAREPLRRGLDLAGRCGAGLLRARAEDELRAAGARPRRLVLTGVESLTPSELRVARLAAQGHTNREIAQSLFVTTATVETHLGHVFQKLALTSRDQLPAALAG